MTQSTLPSDDSVKSAVSDALRLYVGRGRRFSTEAVADATGIPPTTIRAYREGTIAPGLGATLRLAAVLPPAFAGQILALAGLSVAPLDGAGRAAHDLAGDVAGLMARLADALRDGRIDHVERAEIVPHARALGASLAGWADGKGGEGDR